MIIVVDLLFHTFLGPSEKARREKDEGFFNDAVDPFGYDQVCDHPSVFWTFLIARIQQRLPLYEQQKALDLTKKQHLLNIEWLTFVWLLWVVFLGHQ